MALITGAFHDSLLGWLRTPRQSGSMDNSLAYDRQVEAKQKNWLRKKGLQ